MIGFAVMGGIVLGRVQLSTNHAANDAIELQARTERELFKARTEARGNAARVVKLERQFVSMWQRIDGVLAYHAAADDVMEREAARHRLEQLRWDMDVVEARLVAARQVRISNSWRVDVDAPAR